MSQIPTESKIPEREKQLLRREGWLAHRGCTAGANDAPCGLCLNEVALVFPLPKITRPLRATFSDGTVAWWCVDEWVIVSTAFPLRCALSFFVCEHIKTDADARTLGRMLSGETELVPSDEDAGERHA